MPNQREVYLAPFPFSEGNSEKRRPVLVISNSVFNSAGSDILVMAITSNLESAIDGVLIDTTQIETGSLPKTSKILPAKIYALAQTRIEKFICRIQHKPFSLAIQMLKDIVEPA